MLENNRGNRGVLDLKEQLFFAGALIVFLLAGLLWYNYVHRTVLVSPQMLFEQTFLEPVDSIVDLEGDNSLKFGFDYWIRFRSTNSVHLRYPQEFKPSVAEVGRRWFADKWKDDRALHDAASNYQFFMSSNYGVGKVVHDWFLINKKQRRCFYRHWGM
jgi:hypothetical protein